MAIASVVQGLGMPEYVVTQICHYSGKARYKKGKKKSGKGKASAVGCVRIQMAQVLCLRVGEGKGKKDKARTSAFSVPSSIGPSYDTRVGE